MDLAGRKRALRVNVAAQVVAMSRDDRDRADAALVDRLADLPGFAAARTVLLFASALAEEYDTGPMLRFALRSGKVLICPRVDRRGRRLRLHRIVDPARDFRPGPWNIPEPDPGRPEVDPLEVDWALVPGLAFDDRGYRLGRGGGYYDRLLPTLRPEAPRWALAYEVQWVDALPVEPHDARLDGVASPARVVAVDRLADQSTRTETSGGFA